MSDEAFTLMCSLQALKVLKEMQQRKAFTSLLGVSLAEAGKTNDKAQAAQMRSLDLSMHIAAGTLPDAWVVGHQVSDPDDPCTSLVLLAQRTVQGKQLGAAIRCHMTMMFKTVSTTGTVSVSANACEHCVKKS